MGEPGIPVRRQAIFDNLSCEERVSPIRLRGYERFLEEKEFADDTPFFADKGISWNGLHDTYFRQHVAVSDSVTFAQADELTARPGIAGEDWIVRVERIDNSFKDWDSDSDVPVGTALKWLREWAASIASAHAAAPASGKRANTLADLGALVGRPNLPSPSETVEELFEYWNISVRKDSRPSFVAFEAELTELLKDDEWPAHLCQRLGLGHHYFDEEITLAILRYRVRDVLEAEANRGKTCFCAPTVLDSPFGEYFHPAPKDCDWGFAAVLDPAAGDNALVAELLHRRIDYRPEYLWRVGLFKRSPIGDEQLISVRNAHIDRLRRQSNREDFGIRR
ncbi:MAG: hypothetical protein RIS17_1595 [Pseudomonadota bacterium]|jgi:hypothetical protein